MELGLGLGSGHLERCEHLFGDVARRADDDVGHMAAGEHLERVRARMGFGRRVYCRVTSPGARLGGWHARRSGG